MKTILDVQKYWDYRPCNVRHSPAPVGSSEYMAETEARKYFVEPHIPAFAEFWRWRGKRVLEIGCGIGIDTINFAKSGAQVTAIDLSEKSLEVARQRANIKSALVNFVWANAEKLPGFFYQDKPVPGYEFDLVYAFGSIHHSPNPDAILDNARFLLKDSGTLKIMVYNKYSWKALWILLKYGRGKFWKFRELIAKYSEAQTGCPVTHVYSPRELQTMLERHGFIVRKMYKDHIFPYEIDAYKQYRYERTWYWKLVPAPVFRWLERHFGWHLLCEATAC